MGQTPRDGYCASIVVDDDDALGGGVMMLEMLMRTASLANEANSVVSRLVGAHHFRHHRPSHCCSLISLNCRTTKTFWENLD